LIITCVVLAVSVAYAEDSRKNEIGFLLGATVAPTLNVAGTGGTRLEIGTGATFQLTYARRLVTAPHLALYFEVPTLATPLQDITASIGAVPRNYDSFFRGAGTPSEVGTNCQSIAMVFSRRRLRSIRRECE